MEQRMNGKHVLQRPVHQFLNVCMCENMVYPFKKKKIKIWTQVCCWQPSTRNLNRKTKCFSTKISEIIFAAGKNKFIWLLCFGFSYSQSMTVTLLKFRKLFKVLNTWLRLDGPQICGQQAVLSEDRLVLLETEAEPLHGDTVKRWHAILLTFLE